MAAELQAVIADERAGEEAAFGENLEAVAEAHDEAAGVGELLDGADDGRELGDGAAAEIVSVAEAAGEDDHVNIAGNRGFLMPEERRLRAYILRHGVVCIVIAIAPREDNNTGFHRNFIVAARGLADGKVDGPDGELMLLRGAGILDGNLEQIFARRCLRTERHSGFEGADSGIRTGRNGQGFLLSTVDEFALPVKADLKHRGGAGVV